MSLMKALIFDGPGHMRVGERERPVPGPGEVVVRITAAGICGSELTSFTGESTRRAPGLVFGHELAGTVSAAADAADQSLVGMPVAINPLVPCRACRQCLAGRGNVCPNRTLLGMHLDGGFAEEVAVARAQLRPAQRLTDIAGTLVEPMANAVHVTGLLPPVLGRRICVFGAGAIGLCVVEALREAGAGSITVVDPVAARRDLAMHGGATRTLDPADDAAPSLTAEHVVDATGVSAARRAAIDACEPGGTVVLLGLHTAESELQVNAAVAKELRLQCSYAYTAADYESAAQLLEAKRVGFERWITEMPLDGGQDAFEALVKRPGDVTKIVLRPHPAPA